MAMPDEDVGIVEGGVYRSKSGETRHVIFIHQHGAGRSVSWDSVGRGHPDYYDNSAKKRRPHGKVSMKLLQKWAQTSPAKTSAETLAS